jgi:hypothetical protein
MPAFQYTDEHYSEYGKNREGMQAKRAHNTEASTYALIDAGVEYTSHNNGAHLKIKCAQGMIDFWPSTGLYHLTTSQHVKKGRGVRHVIRIAKDKLK